MPRFRLLLGSLCCLLLPLAPALADRYQADSEFYLAGLGVEVGARVEASFGYATERRTHLRHGVG